MSTFRAPALPAPTAWGVAIGAALLFVLGAAPGLTWLDAGELGASAWELGIPHPTGFPLFALAHKAVMLALPVGEIAFRGNLASGSLAAAALGLFFAAGRRAQLSAVPLAVGLFVAATAPALALHAVTIEVYTGAAALLGGAMFLLARPPGQTLDPRRLAALAFLGGLCLGQHAELRLLGVGLAVAGVAGVFPLTGPSKPRLAVVCTLAFLTGALVVAYLPIRAMHDPWRDWGHPATPGALWDHLTAGRIRRAYGAEMGHVRLESLSLFAAEVLGPVAVAAALALPGLARLSRRPGLRVVPVLAVFDLLYCVVVNPMGLSDLQNGLPLMLLLALGLAETLTWLGRRSQPMWAGAGLVAVLWGRVPFLRGFDRGLPALISAALDATPPEGAVFTLSDDLAAGAAFAQVVEGARPDVAVLVRQHLWDPSSVGPVMRRLPGAFGGWRPGAPLSGLPALKAVDRRAALRWESWGGGDEPGRPEGLRPGVPLFTLDVRTSADAALAQARAFAAHAQAEGWFEEVQARRALSRWFFAAADAAPSDLALALCDEALRIEPAARGAGASHAAAALARSGHFIEAAKLAGEAVDASPGDVHARADLARYSLNAGQGAAARGLLDVLIEEAPSNAEFWALRGLAKGQSGDLEGAARDFDQAIVLDPSQPDALSGLGQLGRRHP